MLNTLKSLKQKVSDLTAQYNTQYTAYVAQKTDVDRLEANLWPSEYSTLACDDTLLPVGGSTLCTITVLSTFGTAVSATASDFKISIAPGLSADCLFSCFVSVWLNCLRRGLTALSLLYTQQSPLWDRCSRLIMASL